MKKQIRMYNVMFPLWMLLIFPITWLVVLPANFVIDTAVLLITLKAMKISDMKSHYWKVIWPVWGFGFLSDFIGSGILLLSLVPQGEWWYQHLTNAVALNPFQNLYSFLYVLVATAISGVCIYFFNLKLSFRKLGLDLTQKKKLALSIAIFTAPYLFFFPSQFLYY